LEHHAVALGEVGAVQAVHQHAPLPAWRSGQPDTGALAAEPLATEIGGTPDAQHDLLALRRQRFSTHAAGIDHAAHRVALAAVLSGLGSETDTVRVRRDYEKSLRAAA
jgi:hypothetical protein